MIEAARKKEEFEQATSNNLERPESTRKEVILEAELGQGKREIIAQKEKNGHVQKHYTVSTLSEDVLKIETGLSTKSVFHIVVNHADRFKNPSFILLVGEYNQSALKTNFYNINESQIKLHKSSPCTMIKLQCIYSSKYCNNFHLCLALNFIFTDLMTSIPSRDMNKLSAPSSFSQFGSCRVVIDCTDIEIATPVLMSQRNATY